MRRALRASGSVLSIEGPAGIGKTRLLAEARLRAAGLGLDVLAARGSELERGYGFGIVRQLLEPPLAAASPHARGELLSGAAALAGAVFAAAAEPAPAAEAAQPVLHGLYWLISNLAERSPLLPPRPRRTRRCRSSPRGGSRTPSRALWSRMC